MATSGISTRRAGWPVSAIELTRSSIMPRIAVCNTARPNSPLKRTIGAGILVHDGQWLALLAADAPCSADEES